MFVKLGIPYLAYEIIYYLLYVLVLGKPTSLAFLYPKFSLWYILALFIWRVITPYVKKIPHNIQLAIIAGLLIGFSDMKDNYLSIPRILVFYPFFLAGIHFQREYLTKLRNRISKYAAAVIFLTLTLCLTWYSFYTTFSPKIFYGRYNYDYLGQSPFEGILVRLLCYGVGFSFTFILMLLMSEKKTNYSYIGTRTMAVYLFHGLTYSYLKECTDLLKGINSIAESFLLLAFCAVLVGVFSIPQLTAFTNAVASVQIAEFSGPQRIPYFYVNHFVYCPK